MKNKYFNVQKSTIYHTKNKNIIAICYILGNNLVKLTLFKVEQIEPWQPFSSRGEPAY